MKFTFSQAITIAILLAFAAYLNKQFTAERFFLLVVFLFVATIIPYIAVPVGLIALLWSLFRTPAITAWLASLGSSDPSSPTAETAAGTFTGGK